MRRIGDLMDDRDLGLAQDEQLIALVAQLDREFQLRGLGGVVREEIDDLEPPDPAEP